MQEKLEILIEEYNEEEIEHIIKLTLEGIIYDIRKLERNLKVEKKEGKILIKHKDRQEKILYDNLDKYIEELEENERRKKYGENNVD